MARSHGRILVDVWADDDFLELTPQAQRQFFVLLSQPSLNFAGLLAYQPRRWAATSRHLTLPAVVDALAELSERRYVLIALGTEELVVRSYARHDVRAANPKMAAALASHASQVQSSALRHALADELERIDLDPERNAKSVEALTAAVAVLRKRPITDRIADPITLRNTVQNTDRITDPISDPTTDGITETPALALAIAPTPATAPASAASDDDCSSSPEPGDQAPSSSSKTPTQIDLEQLAAALAAEPRIGPGTDWTRLSDDVIGRIARLLDTHGRDELVRVARARSNGRDAPASPVAWLSAWEAIPTRTSSAATTRCAEHDLEHPATGECRSCRADRLAGDTPTRPNIGGGTPMPADLRDLARTVTSTTGTTTAGTTVTTTSSSPAPPDQPPDEPQAAPVTTPPKTPAPAAATATARFDEPPF